MFFILSSTHQNVDQPEIDCIKLHPKAKAVPMTSEFFVPIITALTQSCESITHTFETSRHS